MKLKNLEEFLITKYKPCCLTCMYRGDVSVSFSPGAKAPEKVDGFPDNVRIDGFQCKHPAHLLKEVKHDDICDKFDAVNPLLSRLFSMKKIL